jgi:hypothetical protein
MFVTINIWSILILSHVLVDLEHKLLIKFPVFLEQLNLEYRKDHNSNSNNVSSLHVKRKH